MIDVVGLWFAFAFDDGKHAEILDVFEKVVTFVTAAMKTFEGVVRMFEIGETFGPVDAFGALDDFVALNSAKGGSDGFNEGDGDNDKYINCAEDRINPREDKKEDNGGVTKGAGEDLKKAIEWLALP